MNQQDDEIDDGSSSGTVDEGRRGVDVDDIIEEEAPAGWRTEEGVGLHGFCRPRCTNGWADGMAVGNHGLETRLSEMWVKLQKYPHRFEAVLSVQGYHGHFACRDFTGGGSFRARCNFGGSCRSTMRQRFILNISGKQGAGRNFRTSLTCTVPNQFALQMSFKTLNPCYVQLKYFTTCIMHATYYSNERFSAFQTYILPLQYELNLNSFL